AEAAAAEQMLEQMVGVGHASIIRNTRRCRILSASSARRRSGPLNGSVIRMSLSCEQTARTPRLRAHAQAADNRVSVGKSCSAFCVALVCALSLGCDAGRAPAHPSNFLADAAPA